MQPKSATSTSNIPPPRNPDASFCSPEQELFCQKSCDQTPIDIIMSATGGQISPATEDSNENDQPKDPLTVAKLESGLEVE